MNHLVRSVPERLGERSQINSGHHRVYRQRYGGVQFSLRSSVIAYSEHSCDQTAQPCNVPGALALKHVDRCV